MSNRVEIKPIKRLQVRLGEQTFVDSARAYAVLETGLPPRYYVPREDVRAELADSAETGSCPWKGKWRHIDVTVGGKRLPSAAWAYFAPTPGCEPIRDYLSFYAQKFDAVDAEI